MPELPGHAEASYNSWIGRKSTSLRRATLDCGCPNRGEVFYHLGCDRLTCQKHAESLHDCAEFGGAKSGIEEESVPVEAAVDSMAVLDGEPLTEDELTVLGALYESGARPTLPAPAMVHHIGLDDLYYIAPPGVMVCTRPMLHNGRHEDERRQFPPPWLSLHRETWATFSPGDHIEVTGLADDTRRFVVASVDSDGTVQVEPLAPPVDAASEPDPDVTPWIDEPQWAAGLDVDDIETPVHRYECPRADCDWTKAALDRDVLLDLAEAHELQAHAPRPWWRRMFPGGTR